MKKAIYILLIMSSMGFTTGSTIQPAPPTGQKRIIDHSSINSGYLEVSAPGSYSLTTGQ